MSTAQVQTVGPGEARFAADSMNGAVIRSDRPWVIPLRSDPNMSPELDVEASLACSLRQIERLEPGNFRAYASVGDGTVCALRFLRPPKTIVRLWVGAQTQVSY